MNNTRRRTLAIVVLIFTAATLVVGATTTQSSSAYLQKKVAQHYDNGKHNWKGNGSTDTDTIQKCKQFASGFDPTFGDQNCDILSNSTIGQAAVTPTPKPTPKTCEECITTFLTPQQITALPPGGIARLCDNLEMGISEDLFRVILSRTGVSGTTADDLIACLKNVGIVFGPGDV